MEMGANDVGSRRQVAQHESAVAVGHGVGRAHAQRGHHRASRGWPDVSVTTPAISWDTVAATLSANLGLNGRGFGETCASAGEGHTATHSSTRTTDARQAEWCMAVPFYQCFSRAPARPFPDCGSFAAHPACGPDRRAPRYVGRTVKLTFWTTDLPEVLSVTLISSR